MDRGRDRRYNDRDTNYGGGETYRPAARHARSPPRDNGYRPPRSPPRRARTPPPVDAYVPRGGRMDERQRSRSPRRRSRSPAIRGRDNFSGYRGGRARTPPRGSGRPRSPLPQRRYSRSPQHGPPSRARSPPPLKRGRDPSPAGGYRQRSPLPTKQSRYPEQGRDGYDRRGHSPQREIPSRFARENNYRPREISRSPPPRQSAHVSRGGSPISSRRSSPPRYSERMAIDTTHHRSPPRRAQSPVRRSPPPEPVNWRDQRDQLDRRDQRDRSPPPRDRELPRNGTTPKTWTAAQISDAPRGPYRNSDARAPPSGPAQSRHDNYSREREPPPQQSGPPSAPISMSAHNRASSTALLSAPTRPRGGPSFGGREYPRDGPYNGPLPHRGGHRHYNGPPPARQPSNEIPTGPRSASVSYQSEGSVAVPNNPRYDSAPQSRVPFRSNNSSSTTYPRTQRFNNHLSSVPAIVEGGKKLPSGLEPAQEKRLQQLEEDKRKLMEAIEEKQRVKRQGLRDWERLEREAARDALRTELAEGHLARLSGEGGLGGGAY